MYLLIATLTIILLSPLALQWWENRHKERLTVIEDITSIVLAVTGVAILAVLVSREAGTKDLIKATDKAFSGVLKAATMPITKPKKSKKKPGLA